MYQECGQFGHQVHIYPFIETTRTPGSHSPLLQQNQGHTAVYIVVIPLSRKNEDIL